MELRLLQRLRSRSPESPLRTRLGRRLLGWFLLFSLVPLFGSNMLGYLESQRIIEDLIRRDLAAIAEVEAQHVRDQMNHLLLDLELTASASESLTVALLASPSGSGGGAAVEAAGRYLDRRLEEAWEFDALYLQRPDERIVSSTDPLDAETRSLPTATLPQGGVDVLATLDRAGQPRFRLLVPVYGDGDRPAGYLGAVMGPRGFGGLLEIPPHLGGSIESFIVDGAGRPLFISHPHGPVDPAAPLATPVLAPDSKGFARYEDRQGVAVFGVAVPVRGFPWRYVAEFPVEAAFGPLHFLRRISVLFGTAFAVLLVITAWVVAGGIVAPVRRLVGAARGVGRGELSVRVDSPARDEIGELGRAFNEMTSDLARARERVAELHRREMERAGQLATVGELASGVAHEIKNPLVGISNGLDLVRRRIGEDGSLAPIMDEMSRQLSRMEVAVRDLLAFARPPTPTLVPADGNEIVRRAVRLVEPAAERARVAVSFEPLAALPPLRVDPELIRQALVNLLMNAVQATPAGGRVELSTALDSGAACFRVADTGKGIPAERLEEIFKPFYTTRHAGSGLGLSISREIVERHGGRIDVTSEAGRGSVFAIRIPIADGAADGAGSES